MKTILPYIALAMLVASIGYAFYLSKQRTDTIAPNAGGMPESIAPTTTSTSLPSSATTSVTSDVGSTTSAVRKIYTNAHFHFSLQYPDDLVIDKQYGTDGTLTLALQDPATNEGFEIYVTPYSETKVTEARFKLDEPSGTYLDPTTVVIAGTPAAMFYGYNPIVGDTFEVWFIKNGLLYEVATYKQLDSWLGDIMQTWQFV
jgi:hypothetical protein